MLTRAALPVDDACVERTAAVIFARLDAAPPQKRVAPPARLSLRWSAGFIAAMALVGVVSGASAPPPRSPAAVAATPVIADGLMGVADAGYYSTRYLAAWAQ